MLFILVYVDDILVTGFDSIALQACIQDLDTHFTLKTLVSINYFLGFEAYRDTSHPIQIYFRSVEKGSNARLQTLCYTHKFGSFID